MTSAVGISANDSYRWFPSHGYPEVDLICPESLPHDLRHGFEAVQSTILCPFRSA